MSEPELNMQVVREYIDATNAWDFDKLRELVHPDEFEFRIPFRPEAFPGSIQGRDTFIGFVEDWSRQVDGSENLADLTIGTLAQDPSQVVTTYTSDMTIKATGHKYLNSYVGMFRVRDGKVTEFFEYLDSIPLLIAAGGSITYPEAE
jgi:ketosteroid isomerase-like protein